MPEAEMELVRDQVTLRFERHVAASSAATWSALVEPSLLRRWLAEAEVDGVLGGEVHLVWPGMGEMRGVVQIWDMPSVVEYTWDESEGSSLVRFEVTDAER